MANDKEVALSSGSSGTAITLSKLTISGSSSSSIKAGSKSNKTGICSMHLEVVEESLKFVFSEYYSLDYDVDPANITASCIFADEMASGHDLPILLLWDMNQTWLVH